MGRLLRTYWPQGVFAVSVIIHVALVTSLWTELANPLFHDTDRLRRAIDFYSVYQAGDAFIDGRSIHDPDPALGVVPYATFAPFKYPPFAAYAVAASLNLIPAREAYWVWVGLMEVLLLVNAGITFAVTPGRAWRWVAAAMWFVFTPYYVELYVGQWSFFVASLSFWASVLLLYRPPVVAMAPAIVATMTKLIPAVLVPVFLKVGGWRVLVLAIACGLLSTCPTFCGIRARLANSGGSTLMCTSMTCSPASSRS